MTSIFLIGPGLIGGESARQAFHDLGVQTVLGTLADKDVIAAQTAASDIVIHTATADDLPSFEAAGHKTIYIRRRESHRYNAEDSYTDFIYDYNEPASIDALPASAAHRAIDLAIVRAGKMAELSRNSKLVIMVPPRLSIQLPTMVRCSIKHSYVTLLHWLEENPAPTVAENPYVFCENGEELSWRVAGKVADQTPQTIPQDMIGSNARNRANRLRKIGWEARKKKTFASLTEDGIPHILLETGEFNGYSAAVASGNFEGNK
ncbi:hypothetical protein BDQ94DRAFT_162659 [Aspergillus welwitschiae]|uniref:NAD(P)-binding domain-containing protein n=1 Tax=Aspergillus welwitschiae TaxID=1341132 RepID=A0A3F3PPK0_9EURO|nr:hypothetical protein BDQ94DRAFT_162659 [Aspergillus welwitschiae]RDH28692.1 hypothetical protein BDQ94DRAFT_162659 [Aspergillus welwitschiae]